MDEILRAGVKASFARPTFYPVGGGWRALARAHIEAVGAPVKAVHGYTVETPVIRAFAKSIARQTAAKLVDMPGVSARRTRTLPAAALTLDRVLKRLAPERVIFSALGLREGLLYSQLDEAERYLDPLVEGAQLIGLPFARVPDFAPALAAWTADLFPHEAPAERRLRVAVCALSDIAWRDAENLKAEESFRRLLQFPFIGVDHAERVFIAAAVHARYAGRADAPWLMPAIGLHHAGAQAASPDSRPRHAARLSLLRRGPVRAGERTVAARPGLRAARGVAGGARARQRGRGRPAALARGGGWREADGDRGAGRDVGRRRRP